MLKTRLLHPPLLAAAAGAGHGSRILLADANYAHDVNVRPHAPVIYLNLRPGLVTVDDVLDLLVEILPLQAAATMQPDENGPVPKVWSRYTELLPDSIALEPIDRAGFYAAARSPELAFAVATGDARFYANLLLTVGAVAAPSDEPAARAAEDE